MTTPPTEQQIDDYAILAITAEHAGERIDPAVVTALVDELRKLQQQRRFLLAQLAKKDAASGRGDQAVRAFLAGGPTGEQPAVAASEACGKCKQPFDLTDTSRDGHNRFYLTPYCRRCVDACQDTEIADHRCVICA